MNISKIEENRTYNYNDSKKFFEHVNFNHPLLVEVDGKTVHFNFPATKTAERNIRKMEDSATKSFFEEILRRMKEEAEIYYKNNPGILELHMEIGLR